MAKLPTLKPGLQLAPSRLVTAVTREQRMTGRKLQNRRLRLWTKNPYCASCGCLTIYPQGFELDHKVPLFLGGLDSDENCQVLCIELKADGTKTGCHVAKSA